MLGVADHDHAVPSRHLDQITAAALAAIRHGISVRLVANTVNSFRMNLWCSWEFASS